MRRLTYVLGVIVLGLGSLAGSDAFAGVTGSIGMWPNVTGNQFELSCTQNNQSDARVTGVSVKMVASVVGIKLSCMRPIASGEYMNYSGSETNWIGTASPSHPTNAVFCPSNKFVVGFNAYTVGSFLDKRILRIRIICARTTYFGQSFPMTFESREVGLQATGGAWNQTDLFCPIRSSAIGAAGKFAPKSVTLLGFRCIDPAKATFAALVDTFRNPRCVTCHSQQGQDGRPVGHPTVNATNCTACHSDNYLPAGTINPGWHMPPDSMRFDGKSNTELCQLALNHPNRFNHLRQDRLVLWAVGGGMVPASQATGPPKQLPKAPPFDIQTWRNGVTAWENDVNGATPSQANPDPCGSASVQ